MTWADPETRKQYNKKYRKEHANELKRAKSRWYFKNKKQALEKSKLWRNNHPGCRTGEKRKYRLKYPHRVWCQHTLYSHRGRGFTTSINSRTLESLAKTITHCPCCGNKLIWSKGDKSHVSPFSPTLDRINNEKMMNKNNIEIICHRCNTAKGAGTKQELLKYCKQVVKNLSGGKRG